MKKPNTANRLETDPVLNKKRSMFARTGWRFTKHHTEAVLFVHTNPRSQILTTGSVCHSMTDSEDLPLVFEPIVFRRVEAFAREALLANNTATVRNSLNALIMLMRDISTARFGYDSVDTRALVELMQRTNPETKTNREPAQNPIEGLAARRLLSLEQIDAAKHIERIWRAFGRHLHIQGRGYTGVGGGRRSQPQGPMAVMGETVYQEWRQVFCPWHSRAARRRVETTAQTVFGHTVVFRVIVDQVVCDQLDKAYKLKGGTCLSVLRSELDSYCQYLEKYQPERTTEEGDPKL
jgi:hypothetical protein